MQGMLAALSVHDQPSYVVGHKTRCFATPLYANMESVYDNKMILKMQIAVLKKATKEEEHRHKQATSSTSKEVGSPRPDYDTTYKRHRSSV